MLIGSQFCANLYVQIAFLSIILFSFDFVCLSVPELLVFTVALFLSDLAVTINQRESVRSEQHKEVLEKLKKGIGNSAVDAAVGK